MAEGKGLETYVGQERVLPRRADNPFDSEASGCITLVWLELLFWVALIAITVVTSC